MAGADVTIQWASAETDATSWVIERSTDNSTWVPLATVDIGVTSYIDRDASDDTYYYRVGAVLDGNTTYSDSVEVEILCSDNPNQRGCDFTGDSPVLWWYEVNEDRNMVAPCWDSTNGYVVYGGLNWGIGVYDPYVSKVVPPSLFPTYVTLNTTWDETNIFTKAYFSELAGKVFLRRKRGPITVFDASDDSSSDITLTDPSGNAWAGEELSFATCDADGKVYAMSSSGGSSVLHRINPGTLAIESTVTGNWGWIDSMAVCPTDGYLWCPQQSTSQIVRIDPATMTEVDRIDVFKGDGTTPFAPCDIYYVDANDSMAVVGGGLPHGELLDEYYQSTGCIFVTTDWQCEMTTEPPFDVSAIYWTSVSYSVPRDALILGGTQLREFRMATRTMIGYSPKNFRLFAMTPNRVYTGEPGMDIQRYLLYALIL